MALRPENRIPAGWLIILGLPATALFLYLFGKALS